MGNTSSMPLICKGRCQPPCPCKAYLPNACYNATQVVFLPRFSPHGGWKTAENSHRTQGSLLPLLDFVDVLRAQLPMRQGTAGLPKLRHKPWTMLQYG